MTYPILHNDEAECEMLDKLRIDGMKYAEKKCSKLKMGDIYPKINILG